MLGRFDHTCHLSIMKWKQGESTALGTARVDRERLIPLFDMPPAGDFDHEKRRPLTPTEHIRLFGQRLHQRWGQRVAFVDAANIDDELHKAGLTRHPLTELLEKARAARALALPVTSVIRPADYQRATKRFVVDNPNLPVCFRITSGELDSGTFEADVKGLLRELGCSAAQVFLVLDFNVQANLADSAVDDFVALLRDRINELPLLHNWLGLAIALSSFPSVIKLKPEQLEAYPRVDFRAYGKLLLNPEGLGRTPMFGDYALDTSPIQKPQRRTPSAHLRYSTPSSYVVSKGHSVKNPRGYGAIYPVADALVARDAYAGPSYSLGDLFINELATRTGGPGNAASWRWAATDHHLTANLRAINSFFGIAEREIAKPSEQFALFKEMESPPTAPANPAEEVARTDLDVPPDDEDLPPSTG
jgi:Beta protein